MWCCVVSAAKPFSLHKKWNADMRHHCFFAKNWFRQFLQKPNKNHGVNNVVSSDFWCSSGSRGKLIYWQTAHISVAESNPNTDYSARVAVINRDHSEFTKKSKKSFFSWVAVLCSGNSSSKACTLSGVPIWAVNPSWVKCALILFYAPNLPCDEWSKTGNSTKQRAACQRTTWGPGTPWFTGKCFKYVEKSIFDLSSDVQQTISYRYLK